MKVGPLVGFLFKIPTNHLVFEDFGQRSYSNFEIQATDVSD